MKSYIGYIYVMLTILFEAVWFYFLEKADWFKNIKYLLVGLLFFNLTTISFAMALKTVDLTVWNVLWVSFSLIFSSLIWYFFFWEKYSLLQYCLIVVILLCIIGLIFTWVKK